MPTLKTQPVTNQPFKINQRVHFKGCKEDEIMLTDRERKHLQRALEKLGIALEPVEEDEASSQERPNKRRRGNERVFPSPRELKDQKMMKSMKAMPAESTGSKDSMDEAVPPQASPEPKWTPSPVAEPAAATLTEEESKAKIELQLLLDKLNDVQLDKLIAIWKPEKDADTGEYILGFESLSEEDRARFRKIVEDLIAEEPKAEATKTETAAQPKPEEPKPEAQAAEATPAAQKAAPQESQQPAPPAMSQEEEEKQKSEAAVEEMLREFDSWI